MSEYNPARRRMLEAAFLQLDAMFSIIAHKHSVKTESPIEAALLEAMIAYNWCEYGKLICIDESPGDSAWRLQMQAQIDNYRVDFLLNDTAFKVKAIIECDGHDFHERTKEQAQRDRSRDRDLQAMGYLVLRFTGSEIWRNPWGCVEQIEQAIWEYDRNRSVD